MPLATHAHFNQASMLCFHVINSGALVQLISSALLFIVLMQVHVCVLACTILSSWVVPQPYMSVAQEGKEEKLASGRKLVLEDFLLLKGPIE